MLQTAVRFKMFNGVSSLNHMTKHLKHLVFNCGIINRIKCCAYDTKKFINWPNTLVQS